MYKLDFISDSFGAVIDEFSPAELAELISQGLLLVKNIHKDQLDIIEQCEYWLQSRRTETPIYDPERVEILKKKSNEADLTYLKLENKGEKEKSHFFFRLMCAFDGLYLLYDMKEYTLHQVQDVIYYFAHSSVDPNQFGRNLERNTILAQRWKQPFLTDLLPVDENFDLDITALKDFYNCDEESLAPPRRIKTTPGKRLKYRLQQSDSEKEIFLSVGGPGLFFFATGLLLYWFNIINLFFGLFFFIFGGGLMFLGILAFISRLQGLKDSIETIEFEKHPIKLSESTKIDIVFKKPVRLDRMIVTLDCYGYDADIAGEPGTAGTESLWSRQVILSKEPVKMSSTDLRIEDISICPTTLYSTDSPMKKVFWSIVINCWIGKRKRHRVFPILVEKE